MKNDQISIKEIRDYIRAIIFRKFEEDAIKYEKDAIKLVKSYLKRKHCSEKQIKEFIKVARPHIEIRLIFGVNEY
jgi:disulfide oxidoreductase YuzD